MAYFSGRGKLYVYTRDTLGNPQAGRWVGNVPELKVAFSTERIVHMESYSGQNLQDVNIQKSTECSVSFILEDFSKENLALALYGTALSVSSGVAITAEKLGGTPDVTSLAVGQSFVAAKRNGTSVVVKDSTGSPKTLTLNTNYTLDAASMTIVLTDVTTGGPFVGPLKVDYTPGASTEVGMFSATPVDLFLRFVGMNKVDSSKAVTVDLYRVSLDPTSDFNLLTEELSQMPLAGTALVDSTKASTASLGQFGAVYQA